MVCQLTDDKPAEILSINDAANALIINANLEGLEVKCLVDCGATATYISEKVVKHLSLRTTPMPKNEKVKLADGRIHEVTLHCPDLPIRLDNQIRHTISPKVLPLGGSQIILGMTWLKAHNPHIDWSAGTITLTKGKKGKKVVIQTYPKA